MTRYVLGIDLGTTSIKVSIFNVDTKQVVDQCSQVTNCDVAVEVEGAHEQSVPKIIDVLNSCLEKIKPNFRRSISKIGVCGQMHGVVLWKIENGDKPWNFVNDAYKIDEQKVSNLYTWQDGRCNPKFLKSLPLPESHLGISTGFGIPTIFWLKKNTPKQLKKYNRAGLISSFVVAMLCDQDQVYTSYQNAASWGYFNCKDLQWNVRILERANFPVELLPEVKSSGVFVGCLSQSWYGIPAGIPVGVDLGDLQCSVISTIETLEDAVINVSTSAQVAFVVNNFLPTNGPPTVEPLNFWPYFNNLYVGVAASLNGGNALVFFVDMLEAWFSDLGVNINKNTLWDTLIRVGMNDTSDPTLNIKPTCLGERFDPKLLASVTNITGLNLSLGEVFKALCRGLVDNLHSQLSSTILKKSKCNRLVGTGLALDQNMLLRNEVERMYQLPLVCKRVGDASKGAALALYTYGEADVPKSPKRNISLTNSMNNDSTANNTTYYSMDGTAQFSKTSLEDMNAVITSTPRNSDTARLDLPSYSPIKTRRRTGDLGTSASPTLDPDSCSTGTGSVKCDITKPCQCPATCKCNSKDTKNYLIILLSDADTDISANKCYPVDNFSEVSETLPSLAKDIQIRFSKNKTGGTSQLSSKPNGLSIDSEYFKYYHNPVDNAQFSQSSPPTSSELPILSAKNKNNRYTVESPSFPKHNDFPTSITRSIPFQNGHQLRNGNIQKSKPTSGLSSNRQSLSRSNPMKNSPEYKEKKPSITTSPISDPASASKTGRSLGHSSDSKSVPRTNLLKTNELSSASASNQTKRNSDEDYTKFLLLQKSAASQDNDLSTESKRYNTISIESAHISTQTTSEFATAITPTHFQDKEKISKGKVTRSNFSPESVPVKTNEFRSEETRNLPNNNINYSPKTSDVSPGHKKYKFYNSNNPQTSASQKSNELPNVPKKYKTFSMDDASYISHTSTQTTSDFVTSTTRPTNFQSSEEAEIDEIQKQKPSGISPLTRLAPMKTSDLPTTETNNIPKSSKNTSNELSVDSDKNKYFKNSFDSDYEFSESLPSQKTNDLPSTPRRNSARATTRSVPISRQDFRRSAARSFPKSTSPQHNDFRNLDTTLFNDKAISAPTTDVASRFVSDSVSTSAPLKDNTNTMEEYSQLLSTASPPPDGELPNLLGTNITDRNSEDDYSKFLLSQKSPSPENGDLPIEVKKYRTFSIDGPSPFSHVSTQTTSDLAISIAPPSNFQEENNPKSGHTKNTTSPINVPKSVSEHTQTAEVAPGLVSNQIPRSIDSPIALTNTEEGSSKIKENSSTKYKTFSHISLTSSSSKNDEFQISKTIPENTNTRNNDILEYKDTSEPISSPKSEKYKTYNETADLSIASNNIPEYLSISVSTSDLPTAFASVERPDAIKYNLLVPPSPTSPSSAKSAPIKQNESNEELKPVVNDIFANTKPKYLSTVTPIADLVPNSPSNLRLATIKNGDTPKDLERSRKTSDPDASSTLPLTSKVSDLKGPPTPVMSDILVDTIPTHLVDSTPIRDLTGINRSTILDRTSDLSLGDYWEYPPTPIMSTILIPTVPNYVSQSLNATTENNSHGQFSSIIRPITALFSTLTSPPISASIEENDSEEATRPITPEPLVRRSLPEDFPATASISVPISASPIRKRDSTSALEPKLRTPHGSVSEESCDLEQPGTPVMSTFLVPNIPRYFQSTISMSSSKAGRRSASSLPKSKRK